MTRTEFRKLIFFSYSLQHPSHDFEKNRETILRRNESITTQLGSESASAICSQEQQEATTHHGSKSDILTLKKQAIVLVYIIAWSAVVLGINSTSNAGSNFLLNVGVT